MVERKQTDWEAIEREYRAGQLSVREIARLYEISHTAINKRAKDRGWTQNLAAKVREQVSNQLVSTEVSNSSARDAIELAAARGIELIRSHRSDLSQLRSLASILAERLSQYLDGVKPDGPGIGDKESPADMLSKLTGIKAKLIPLERQAFSLDEEPNGSDQPVRIERVIIDPIANPNASGIRAASASRAL